MKVKTNLKAGGGSCFSGVFPGGVESSLVKFGQHCGRIWLAGGCALQHEQ